MPELKTGVDKDKDKKDKLEDDEATGLLLACGVLGFRVSGFRVWVTRV